VLKCARGQGVVGFMAKFRGDLPAPVLAQQALEHARRVVRGHSYAASVAAAEPSGANALCACACLCEDLIGSCSLSQAQAWHGCWAAQRRAPALQ
jgi:hypothetical protein